MTYRTFARTIRTSSMTHVPVSALSATVVCVLSAEVYISVAHVRHRQKNFYCI
jgi:hypothetical protein